MTVIPVRKTGLARIWAALFYSLDGLRSAVHNEASFRQEMFVFVILLVSLFFLPVSVYFRCLLFFANTLVLIVELLNSSIESIADMVSPKYHILAKQAKDLGSAAVMLSLVLAVILWGTAIFLILKG